MNVFQQLSSCWSECLFVEEKHSGGHDLTSFVFSLRQNYFGGDDSSRKPS